MSKPVPLGMACHYCGKQGRCIGSHRTPVKKNLISHFRCDNKACTFDYINFDGQPAKGQPTWSYPTSWIGKK